MFLVFHILMFLFIYPPSQNSLIINKKNQNVSSGKRTTLQTGDHIQNNTTKFSTHKFLFEIIQNLTKTKPTNLKSNVFDKMLSDEMLSIQKHFYEKDNLRSTISVMTSNKNTVATPTLEVKQNWPMIHSLINKPVNVDKDVNSLENNNKIDKLLPGFKIGEKLAKVDEELQNGKVNEKVLGLRSLPEAVPLVHHPPYQGYKVCTCMKTNPSTTCRHHCTGVGSTASCSHKSNCAECTRNTQQYSISHIYYQPYFVGVTTQLPYVNTYYHPDVINELKVPRKPKHRKPTKHYFDKELYYDRNDDYYDDYLDYYKAIRKPDVNNEMEDTINIHVIEYEDNEKKKRKHKKKCNHHVKKKKRDKLVQDVFDDLKYYYSDSVIKDCYCGSFSSSSSFIYNHILLFVVYVLCLVVY